MVDPIAPDAGAAPSWFAYARKAVAAFAVGAAATLASLATSLTAASDGGTAVTTVEWVRAAIAAFGALASAGLVYAVPNTYTAGRRTTRAAPGTTFRPPDISAVRQVDRERGL